MRFARKSSQQSLTTISKSPAPYMVPLLVLTWVVTSLVVVGVRRYAVWDEAIYLARGLGRPESFGWGPSRALGMPIVTSMVTWWQTTVVVVRVVVLIVNACIAFLAITTWRRLVGSGALVGPALVLFSWVGLVYGSEILPNLLSGLLMLWSVGASWTWLVGGRRIDALAAVCAMTGLGLVRPTALVCMLLGSGVVALISRTVRVHAVRLFFGAVCVGTIAVTPWVIEAFVYFDNPVSRLRVATPQADSFDIGDSATAFLWTLATEPVGSGMTLKTISLLAFLIVAAIVGVWAMQQKFGSRPDVGAPAETILTGALHLAVAVGLSELVFYFLVPVSGHFTSSGVRFHLPALILLSVPVGVGVVRVWPRRSGRVAVCLVAIPFIVLQLTAAHDESEDLTIGRGRIRQLGAILEKNNVSAKCRFESPKAWPVVQLRSGCSGSRTTDPEQSFYRLDLEASDVTTFLLWEGQLEHPSNWSELELLIPGKWHIYVRSSD